MRRLGLAAALLAGAAIAAPAAPPSGDLLPPDGFLGTWARAEAARVFPGSELYGHIDGGAELFLELGFEALSVQRYARGEDAFVLEVYRMADPEAALGIYLFKCGDETPDPGFRERHTAGRYQLALVKGPYYVLVENEAGRPDLAPALLDFGRYVASRVEPADVSGLLALLPAEGRVERSVRIVRGPFGLQAVADLGPGDVLRLKGKGTAVAADYRNPGNGTRTRIVARYGSPEDARAAFAGLPERLDPATKVNERSESRLVFRDAAGRRGVATLEGALLRLEM